MGSQIPCQHLNNWIWTYRESFTPAVLALYGQPTLEFVPGELEVNNQFGSGRVINARHSEVRVYRVKKDGTVGKLKRVEPTYPTSGRAKPKKYHHK